MNKTQIQQARQTDLAQFLISFGVPLVRIGHRHKHKDHDSLIFTNNAYYWNSRQDKGNAVDYLTKHMGYTFSEAIEALTGFTFEKENFGTAKKELSSLLINKNYRRAIAYLHKTRHIDYSIVQILIIERLLMQEEHTNNAIFPMYDENGEYVGAELEGTLSEHRFKGITAGSKYGYGFSVRFPDGAHRYQYALFFESAVDLISFIDIKRHYDKKPLTGCMLVSMAGLKPNVVQHTLEAFGGRLQPFLCVDNDKAGQIFIDGLGSGYSVLQPPQGKDWNEQLQNLKSGQLKKYR
jgi:hypothetical protein